MPWLVRRFGEGNPLRLGYTIQAPALAFVPFAHPWAPLMVACLALGTGSGLSTPNLSSLISKAAPPAIVGGIFGVTQSLGAIARILGPVLGNTLYEFEHWLPYAFAAVLMVVPLAMAQFIRRPKPALEH